MPIDTHLSYFQKNRFCERQIAGGPHPELGIVVVIPCHNERDLKASISSLMNCDTPNCAVEVIVVINAGKSDSEEIKKQNEASFESVSGLQQNERFKIHLILENELPDKFAGVGLARKIGMDEAAERLSESENGEGVLLCYDADSNCDPNYLVEVEKHFELHPKIASCSIYFEHPLEGEFEVNVYEGIIRYELYLRYYVLALRWAGYPYAFETIGSSMAVRSGWYCKQGGMNRRKAGEDFYFLHKFIPLGIHSELNETRVIPSPRQSDRVPFGTGKAIGDYLASPQPNYPVYAFDSFKDLKSFIQVVHTSLYGWENSLTEFKNLLPESVSVYLTEIGFEKAMVEIKKQTTHRISFLNRFFQWFNGLKVLQYFHFAREKYYKNESVSKCVEELLNELKVSSTELSEKELLVLIRKYERGMNLPAPVID